MTKIKGLIICITVLCTMLVTACSQGNTPVDETSSSTEITNDSIEDGTDAPTELPTESPTDAPTEAPTEKPDVPTQDTPVEDEEQLYKSFFDINNKVEMDIDISEEEIAKLQEDYEHNDKSSVSRLCNVTFRITTSEGVQEYYLKEVGIRLKGNTSRTDFYSEDDGIYNLNHLKLDFQETFDDPEQYDEGEYQLSSDPEVIKDRTFATLEKLELKWNMMDDATYVREHYAYETYRDYGILAPNMTLSTITFGGTYEGVFKVYEPVDKTFLKRYLPESAVGGDLYKCGWTMIGASFDEDCSIGIEDDANRIFYNYDLKTNKKTSSHESLKELIKYVNSSEISKEGLKEYVDMDYFIKYLAVAYFVGDPDDMRSNYNNYYIYFMADTGKMIIIPYDNDRSYGQTKLWNPSGNGMTEVSPYTDKAVGNRYLRQKNPLINYTVTENRGLYIDEYREILEDVAQSKWLTEENFKKYYDIVSNNFDGCTKPSKEFRNAQGYVFNFDLTLGGKVSSDRYSASFAKYIEAKLNYYNSNK